MTLVMYGDVQRSRSLHTMVRLYSACVMTVLLYGCETWTLNKRMCPSVSYAMAAQNPLNQVERLHPECYRGRHMWLGQHHQRARRLALFSHVARFSCDVPASNILSICCASGDGYPPPDPS